VLFSPPKLRGSRTGPLERKYRDSRRGGEKQKKNAHTEREEDVKRKNETALDRKEQITGFRIIRREAELPRRRDT